MFEPIRVLGEQRNHKMERLDLFPQALYIHHRKKLRNTPEAIHARQAWKMRKYCRRRHQKAEHERWLKKPADAALKKQAKAERRAKREAIVAEELRCVLLRGFLPRIKLPLR